MKADFNITLLVLPCIDFLRNAGRVLVVTWERLGEAWSQTSEVLFGFDYFIAHRSSDGKVYAERLHCELTAEGNAMDCFLDVKHYSAGDSLRWMQTSALRKTTRLLVIVTCGAHFQDSVHLLNEVREFKRLHPRGKIVPIGTSRNLETQYQPNSQLLALLPRPPDDICIIEDDDSLHAGKPSAKVISKLLNDFTEQRRGIIRQRWLKGAVGLLSMLLIIATAEWQQSSERGKSLITSLQQEKAAKDEAKRQLGIARSRYLAILSLSERIRRLDRSLLLAAESYEANGTREARDSLFRSLQARPGLIRFMQVDGPIPLCIAFTPDGKVLAVGHASGVDLYDALKESPQTPVRLDIPENPVTSLAISPNGKYVAAAYVNFAHAVMCRVCVFDIATRKRGAVDFINPYTAVHAMAFSPDSRSLVATGYKGVLLFNVADGKVQNFPLFSADEQVQAIAFHPNGKLLAIGYAARQQGGIVLFNVVDRTRTSEIKLPEGEVQTVAFSPDGKQLAAGFGHDAGGVVFYDATSIPMARRAIQLVEGKVTSINYSPQGSKLAIAFQNRTAGGEVVIYNTVEKRREPIAPFSLPERTVTSVAFHPQNDEFAAGFGVLHENGFLGNGGFAMFATTHLSCLERVSLPGLKEQIKCAASSPDKAVFAMGYAGGVALFRGKDLEPLRNVQIKIDGSVDNIAFSPDGNTVGVLYDNADQYFIAMLNWKTGALLRSKMLPADSERIRGDVWLTFNVDGSALAVCTHGHRRLALYQSNDLMLRPFSVSSILSKDTSSVVLSPDFSLAAIWDLFGNEVLFVDTAGNFVKNRVSIKEWPGRFVFSPDGKTLIGSEKSGRELLCLDSKSGTRKPGPNLLPNWFSDQIVFSPDGQVLAVTGRMDKDKRNSVIVFQMNGNRFAHPVPIAIGEGRINALEFSADNRTLAIGSVNDRDSNIVLIDVLGENRLLSDPLSVGGSIKWLGFASGGTKVIANYSGDGSGVLVWDVNPESWGHLARRIANRELNQIERQDFGIKWEAGNIAHPAQP